MPAADADRDALAALLLDAYRGTIDDEGRHYIDPVATAASRKGRGIGAWAVATSIRLLQRDGVGGVGAVITDGNVASERLFARLGFTRVGPWG